MRSLHDAYEMNVDTRMARRVRPHGSTRERLDEFWWNFVRIICHWKLPQTRALNFLQLTIPTWWTHELWDMTDTDAKVPELCMVTDLWKTWTFIKVFPFCKFGDKNMAAELKLYLAFDLVAITNELLQLWLVSYLKAWQWCEFFMLIATNLEGRWICKVR
jgi:hypothetical protein